MTVSDAGPIVRQEIAQQPAVVQRLLAGAADGPIAAVAQRLRAARPAHVVLVARGTSDNVARYAQHLLGRFCGLPATLATPSLLTIYGAEIRYDDAFVLAISQSGGSPDITAVAADARRRGVPTAAITNTVDSPLAGAVEQVIDLGAGPERAVAATKSYTSSLAAVAALVAHLHGGEELLAELAGVADAMARQLAREEPVVDGVAGWDRLAITGRVPHLATAFEAALKIKELTGVAAEPYSPTDLLHGPIATVGPQVPLLAFATGGPGLESTREAIDAARLRGAPIVTFADAGAEAADDEQVVAVEPGPDWLSPLVAILPAQRLGVGMAAARGIDVDAPNGLRKVTKTN